MSFSYQYCLIFFLSFTILSLEVLLSVLLSALFFSPFFAVSFAFLGLSLAGVFVTVWGSKKTAEEAKSVLSGSLLLAGASLLIFVFVTKFFHVINSLFEFRAIAFPSREGMGPEDYWNRLLMCTLGNSLVLGLISTVVFFFLGVIYSLIYKFNSNNSARVYCFDLTGAAGGCLFATLILNVLQMSSALILLSLLSFAVFLFLFWREHRTSSKAAGVFCLLSVVCVLFFNIRTDFFEIKFGVLNGRKKKTEANLLEIKHQWNTYSRASLFVDPNIKKAVYNSKYAFSIVNGSGYIWPYIKENPYRFKMGDGFSPVSLSFVLTQPRDILILMAGPSRDMIEAYSYSRGLADITGVELNPILVKMGRDLPGYHLNEFFAKNNVHLIISEGRSYIESVSNKFDAIVLSSSGSSRSKFLGVSGPTSQYLFTKEALKSYLRHLKPGGTISFTNGNKFKIVAMAREVLEELGYGNAAGKVIVVAKKKDVENLYSNNDISSGSDYFRVLIRNTDFTRDEVDRMHQYVLRIDYAVVYDPYRPANGFLLFEQLLKCADIKTFLRRSQELNNEDFSIPTDDAPFIDNGFLINSFFDANLWNALVKGDWNMQKRQVVFNFSILFFTVFLALVGAVLIFIPLRIHSQRFIAGHLKFLGYFALIGLGFIFAEIAIMQLLTLLLGNPVYSFSAVLLALLLSTAWGSLCSEYLFAKGLMNIRRLSLSVFCLLTLYFFWMPSVVEDCLGAFLMLRFLIAGILIFPLGFLLGMFFPQGLINLGKEQKDLIPWAWGLNGYMTIIGSALSISLSRLTGFSFLLLLAAFFYLTVILFSFSSRKGRGVLCEI